MRRMKPFLIARRTRVMSTWAILTVMFAFAACSTSVEQRSAPGMRAEPERGMVAQVPSWSADDMQFFLHGTMSTEVLPERVLRAFVRTYPDLYPHVDSPRTSDVLRLAPPRADLTQFGLIPDPAFSWPIGVSRRPLAYLGGLSSIGINCASCHTAEIVAPGA